jgi:hypothetical protein
MRRFLSCLVLMIMWTSRSDAVTVQVGFALTQPAAYAGQVTAMGGAITPNALAIMGGMPVFRTFGSVGAAGGSIITNLTGKVVTDLEIRLSPQPAAPATPNVFGTVNPRNDGAIMNIMYNTGGAVFTTSMNGMLLTVTGISLARNATFWLKLPMDTATLRYQGHASISPLPSSLLTFGTVLFLVAGFLWRQARVTKITGDLSFAA